jgi:DNA-binding MarR family transcriptional regulator
MEKAEKLPRATPRKPPISAIRVMPSSLSGIFVAASVGRLSNLFPRWMGSKLETIHDVTSSQLMVIFLLSQFKEMTLGQLAQMLDFTPRAITGIMAGLEKKRYIIRRKDPEDNRITWVSLSETGKSFLKVARPDAAKKFAGLFGVLSKKEQIELVRIIEKLTDHMNSQINEDE